MWSGQGNAPSGGWISQFLNGPRPVILSALTVRSGPGVIRGPSSGGQVAQLVEQRTENPRVGGSIPPLATTL